MKIDDLIRFTISNEGVSNYTPDRYGMANAYVAIPCGNQTLDFYIQYLANGEDDDIGPCYPFDNMEVHGGVTFYDIDTINDFACPYSKVLTDEEWTKQYHIVGWDTRHLHDNSKEWNYKSIIQENERFANYVAETLTKAGF